MKTKTFSRILLLSISFLGLPIAADSKTPSKKGTKIMIAPKIAVVDRRRMLAQDPQLLKDDMVVSHEWRDLVTKLQETLKPAQAEFTELQKKLQEKGKELEALQKSGVSSKEALQKKYQEEGAPLEMRLQQMYQQLQGFSTSEQNKINNIVLPKIKKATDEIVKSQGWDFAINEEALTSTVSSGSRFNITSDVLQILNTQYAKDKAAKAKAAPAK